MKHKLSYSLLLSLVVLFSFNLALAQYAARDFRAAIESVEKARSMLGGEIPNG